MTASSNERSDVLADIETKYVQQLLAAISKLKIRRKDFVQANYAEQARNFTSTLHFLKDIQWVREEEENLIITSEGDNAIKDIDNAVEIRAKLAGAIIAEVSPYRKLVADYLNKFRSVDSGLVYQPTLPDRLRESNLRNFLMDLGLVTYRPTDDMYLLEEEGVDVYVWATNLKRAISPERFRADSQRREELGFRAELAVVDYEKGRLGPKFSSRVDHVSAKRPFASYDIKSVSLQEGKTIARYIEVKAGPADTYEFYWSASEVEAARLLRTKYFLYVLPVRVGGGFNLEKMLILQDPIVSVYQNAERWDIEENVILCKQRA